MRRGVCQERQTEVDIRETRTRIIIIAARTSVALHESSNCLCFLLGIGSLVFYGYVFTKGNPAVKFKFKPVKQ